MLRLVLGDCIEKMRDIPEGAIGTIITDPPYGIQFMGKNWDAPWKDPIAEHGFSDGGNGLPAPSFSTSRNPTCQACGLRQRTWESGPEKCGCDEPEFDLDTVSDRQAFQAWCVAWLTECYRILAPGGVIKTFGGSRMFHRLAAAMEEVGFILESDHSLEGWGYGCLTEDTEVLTHQYGWVPYQQVKVGTVIMGFDPHTRGLAWQPVGETFEYPYDREAFHIIGDGTDHIVSTGHRCIVQRDGKWAFVLSDDLEGEEVVPIMLRVSGSDPHERGDGLTCFATTARVERVHYTGIVWCVKVPTGAFVARRNGMAFVTGNSGFPKSLNVSLTLDKAARGYPQGSTKGDPGKRARGAIPHRNVFNMGGSNGGAPTGLTDDYADFVALTDEAKQFDGYGTALKPAFEPILVGRKPVP